MVDGIKALEKRLTKTIPEVIRKAASDAMEKGAQEVVDMMKRRVPRDTGELASTIGWSWGDAPKGSMIIGEVRGRQYNTMRIVIYAGSDKTRVGSRNQFQLARLLEFGTLKMGPKPFFFGSWRANKKRVRSRVTRAIREAIKRENGL
ncbi:HK97-gp10 family putative phage morphogenesis protein [Ochrobactrum sp. A-1]|uniref:HK97-gp10 family putative phage morphogenesis protein n=1 Tax=Ochrobactrum sp. A-1 TaxID=2920940 RepID=UPI001F0A5D1D|nr:HK97 gp10 family phage protein [Ochrobactrum sp. A-1]